MSLKSTLEEANPKVTASAAAVAIIMLLAGLLEWLVGEPVPVYVTGPAATLGAYWSGWLKRTQPKGT